MPENHCHERREFGDWTFEFNKDTDWMWLSWYHPETGFQFTNNVYMEEERAERVDYWPSNVVVNDFNLTEPPVEASSVDLIYSDEQSTGLDLSYEIVTPQSDKLYLNYNIQVYDSTNLHQFLELTDYYSFDCALQQVIRQNETDRDMVMMLKSDESADELLFTQEKQLHLAPGFTKEEYTFSPDGKL